MDNALNKRITQSVKEIFTTVFGEAPRPGEVYATQHKVLKPWDISGFTAISGKHPGVIALRMKYDFANMLLTRSRVQPQNRHEHWYMVHDMVSELVNTLSGNIVSGPLFEGAGISVPIYVTGEGHLIDHVGQGEIVCIPFTLLSGGFEVEYSFLV